MTTFLLAFVKLKTWDPAPKIKILKEIEVVPQSSSLYMKLCVATKCMQIHFYDKMIFEVDRLAYLVVLF